MKINKYVKNILLSLDLYPTDIKSLSKLFQSLYNTDYLPRLDGLINIKKHSIYSNYYSLFFENLLPWMFNRIKIFLRSERFEIIDRLKQGIERNIIISKSDVLDLILSMFFGLYSNPQHAHHIDLYAWITSSQPIYSEKLLCLFEYLRQNLLNGIDKDSLIIERKVLNPIFTKESFHDKILEIKDSLSNNIYKKMILDDEGLIGDREGEAEVDFANKYIGGYVLFTGSVQEEIMFVLNPELLITMLYCDIICPNESILIHNVVTYAQYKGYSRTFQFDGPSSKLLNHNRGHTVIAIDALNYRYDFSDQFSESNILREINKIYVGFSSISKEIPIGSGKWGCGAFNGFSPLKILLQWIISCMNNQELHIYTFGDRELSKSFSNFQSFLIDQNISLDHLVDSYIL